MKDKLASYNHLIETFVIVTETFLCGLLFLLFSKLSNKMQWDSLQVGGTTVLQVMLTLMLCYALCAIHWRRFISRLNGPQKPFTQ